MPENLYASQLKQNHQKLPTLNPTNNDSLNYNSLTEFAGSQKIMLLH